MAYKDPNDPRLAKAKQRYYEKNKEAYQARARQREQDMLNFVREYKNKPCMDCKMSYPAYVMDLDHRDREDKIGDMGSLIRRGVWKILIAELEKCDVVCSNCHRIRTAAQMGWV